MLRLPSRLRSMRLPLPLASIRLPARVLALRVPRRLAAMSLRQRLLCLAVVPVLGVGGWLVLRDSSLFSVENVRLVGLTGDAAPAVSEDLLAAARSQTTTNFSVGRAARRRLALHADRGRARAAAAAARAADRGRRAPADRAPGRRAASGS